MDIIYAVYYYAYIYLMITAVTQQLIFDQS